MPWRAQEFLGFDDFSPAIVSGSGPTRKRSTGEAISFYFFSEHSWFPKLGLEAIAIRLEAIAIIELKHVETNIAKEMMDFDIPCRALSTQRSVRMGSPI